MSRSTLPTETRSVAASAGGAAGGTRRVAVGAGAEAAAATEAVAGAAAAAGRSARRPGAPGWKPARAGRHELDLVARDVEGEQAEQFLVAARRLDG